MGAYANYTSSADIYKKLKDDILTLRLKPGQMISENEIAAVYNVSRTPIKTAFLRLKGEKYIDIIPQKGSFVALLDMKYIKDIIYMRTVLELDMLTNIIEKGLTQKAADVLDSNLAQQRELIHSDHITPVSFYDLDSAFHNSLFIIMNHEKMWEVIQDCQVYYTRFRILDTMTTTRYEELYNEHLNIVNALKSKDTTLLRTHVFNHLHGNLRTLASKIEKEYKDYFV